MTLEKEGVACGQETVLRTMNCDKFRCWVTGVSRRGYQHVDEKRETNFRAVLANELLLWNLLYPADDASVVVLRRYALYQLSPL